MKPNQTMRGKYRVTTPFMRQSGRNAADVKLEGVEEVHNRAQRRRRISRERKAKRGEEN
jgi:hypothetical protein